MFTRELRNLLFRLIGTQIGASIFDAHVLELDKLAFLLNVDVVVAAFFG